MTQGQGPQWTQGQDLADLTNSLDFVILADLANLADLAKSSISLDSLALELALVNLVNPVALVDLTKNYRPR